jgi:hypothetical protein
MGKRSIINLAFPLAGVQKNTAFQTQPPFSTPDALNVKPDGVKGRTRGGSRPGVVSAVQNTTVPHANLVNSVPIQEISGFTYWSDPFHGDALGSFWTQASWLTASPTIGDGVASTIKSDGEVGVVRDAFSPVIDNTSPYRITMKIHPHKGEHHGTYKIFMRMDAGLDATDDGMVVQLDVTGDVVTIPTTGSLKTYVGGVVQSTTNFAASKTIGYSAPLLFTVEVNPSTDIIDVYVNEHNVIANQDVSADVVPAGDRWGWGMETTVAGGKNIVDFVRIQYTKGGAGATARQTRNQLVVGFGQALTREGFMGELVTVTSSDSTILGNGSFPNVTLDSTSRLGKLYIADQADPWSSATDGALSSKALTSTAVGDFAADGVTTRDVVVIYEGGTGATAGTYEITTVATTTITLTTDPGDATGVSFAVVKGPVVYDPLGAGDVTRWTASTAGVIPGGCTIVKTYRDRMILAGDPNNAHEINFSAVGDPDDWDTSVSVSTGAVTLTVSDSAAKMPEPVTAIMPHSDDCVLIGCNNSLWIMRGDPRLGGHIDAISYHVGVFSQQSWIETPTGELVFMSTSDGIYVLPSGCNVTEASLVSASRAILPSEFLELNPDNQRVMMAYDMKNRGIHIFITRIDAGPTTHWWYDWELKSLWPIRFANSAHDPLTVHSYNSLDPLNSAVIMGGKNGVIRQFDVEANEDHNGTAIASHVYYGPFSLSGDGYHDGLLQELKATTGKDSGTIKWDVYAGTDPEDAFVKTESDQNGEFTLEGLNYSEHPRVRGNAALVKISGEGSRSWTMERLIAVREARGKQRLIL